MTAGRVFVANRGEIALRVIDACDRLGIETVLGVSSADTATLAAKRAGRTLVLGEPRSTTSYLDVNAVTHAAVASGCDAVHPGYGFLSERADFARLCGDNGLIFIGPTPEQLEALGDKLSARRLAEQVGVPVSPGGPTRTVEEAVVLGSGIGYPLLVKAAHGGGGRGMKLVDDQAGLAAAWKVAAAEAEAAFGDGTVFIERFVQAAKHIEVQILGDGTGNCIHLGERECSLQFRYQKVMEEAPCSAISDAARRRLHAYALQIAEGLKYRSLGTVEFLYDVGSGDIRFLEVNPRVQVEHPVTEAVTGVDLVREQILLAYGRPLSLRQDDVAVRGHAVELRLTAQDPQNRLRPSPGRLQSFRPAPIGGVRYDTHLYEGYLFPPYYDALMAKIIAYGEDRAGALERARQAVRRLELSGPVTNIALLEKLLADPVIADNGVTTRWLEEQFEAGVYP